MSYLKNLKCRECEREHSRGGRRIPKALHYLNQIGVIVEPVERDVIE